MSTPRWLLLLAAYFGALIAAWPLDLWRWLIVWVGVTVACQLVIRVSKEREHPRGQS